MNEPDLLTTEQRTAQPEPAAARHKVPDLKPGEIALVYLAVATLLAVGSLGLFASFQSVTAAATRWGFDTPQIVPIAIDLAIPGFTITHLLLIRLDMELAWVRAVPWALTAVTVYLNIQAGSTLPAQIGHGALPLVWVVCSEIAAHVYRCLIDAATEKRMERVRRSRWFLAPVSTGSLWRRMILWEETSYRDAIRRERDRKLARASLRETYGLLWRFRAPLRDRVLLRMGDLNPAGLVTPETETSETETTSETVTVERIETGTGETETRDLPGAETETSRPALETETTSRVQCETAETATAQRRHETKTETVPVSTRSTAETETGPVTPLGDRDVRAEIDRLVSLMRDRGSETAVGLTEAISETGRPKSTAAKRLKAARDLYRTETKRETETAAETGTNN